MVEIVTPRCDPPHAQSTGPLPVSAAHEINNPLDSLLNLLYLLEAEATLTEKGRHYLTLAQEEVRRISQIARDMLKQHRVEPTAEKTNVVELLAAVLDFYKQRLDSSGIVVQTRYSCDDSIPVYGEELRRVFSNLLLNAVEAMPEGGKLHARVSAAREWSGQERRGVRVTVADSGSGIPPNVRRQIFDPFFTTKSHGHGMGLALVKDIVQRHKGSLCVRSSTQPCRSGTVFKLFLPAA
jgi:two-component system NtrC family sensor kinase